jgi:integrase
MAYLEKRKQLYYALLTVPEGARDKLGKLRFVKSTNTGDRREAQQIANQYVAGWKVLIKKALNGNDSKLLEAIQWRESIENANSEEEREILEDRLLDKAYELEESEGFPKAKELYDIAVGIKTPITLHHEQWKSQLRLEPKTVDQMLKDVDLLINEFSCIEQVNSTSAMKWVNKLAAEGKTLSSQKRILGNCRNYWGYLKSKKLIPIESNPFTGLITEPTGKAARKIKANAPYSPQQLVMLWNAALSQTIRNKPHSDQQLADLILLSAYTGTRIEEICSLKVTDVTDTTFRFTDSKTEAGIREVPIHSKLLERVKQLKDISKDGYLLSGLTFNKYKDRSNALGKRFGRLKTKLGFSPRVHTAHSFRSTLITMLENAGVSENLAADIVGHEKPRITYGLYSGGATLEVMREAIEKVNYPF